MARPTKYNAEVLEKARDYLKTYQKQGDLVPSIVGLCVFLGITTKTAYNWVNDGVHDEFLHILDECADKQHKELVNGGLGGAFNANITKMMLTKHGYSDKQEIDHTTKGEKVGGIDVKFHKADGE